MNASKWNAYNLAVLMSIELPNGFSVKVWESMIEENLGTDKRTIAKYKRIMRKNGYVIKNPQSSKFKEDLIVNPDIENMKPKSLKQLISEKQRVKNETV